ncbi:MAG: hypothetical protein ISS25_03425 [Nanoarchaeota archaeon]|nr:hypothetical protein [Nanoarchaeota archaeon]
MLNKKGYGSLVPFTVFLLGLALLIGGLLELPALLSWLGVVLVLLSLALWIRTHVVEDKSRIY